MKNIFSLIIALLSLTHNAFANEGSHGTRDGGDYLLTLPGIIEDSYEIRMLIHYREFSTYTRGQVPEIHPYPFSAPFRAHYLELVYRIQPSRYHTEGLEGVMHLEGRFLGNVYGHHLEDQIPSFPVSLEFSDRGVYWAPEIRFTDRPSASLHYNHNLNFTQSMRTSPTRLSRFYRITADNQRQEISREELKDIISEDLRTVETQALRDHSPEVLITAEHVFSVWDKVFNSASSYHRYRIDRIISEAAQRDFAPLSRLLQESSTITDEYPNGLCQEANWRALHETLSTWQSNGFCSRLYSSSFALPESALTGRLVDQCRLASEPFLRQYFETAAFICNRSSLNATPSLLNRLRSILSEEAE